MYYRHELKYEISDIELEIIYHRLAPLMQADEHQQGRMYSVRSLYFDDISDSCLSENEDGNDNRRKFRIRIYNGCSDVIRLEKKSKVRGMTHKESVSLTEEICRQYLKSEAPPISQAVTLLEKELYSEMKMCGMSPKSIVEYERTAFVDYRGNVRITFDRNIRGSTDISGFLEPQIPAVPLLPTNKHVLEVKYDEFLPEYIEQTICLGSLQRTAFSKYYYSRAIQLM